MAEKKTTHLTMLSILKPSQARIKVLADKKGRTIRAYMDELFNKDSNVLSISNELYAHLKLLAAEDGRTIEGFINSLIKDK